MTLPEAMKIVSDNANKLAKHNYVDVYLPAILVVNEAFPVTGYVTIDDEWGSDEHGSQRMISDGNDAAYGLKEQGR